MGKARTSKALFKKWESANSLEQGNGQYIRHNIRTKAGQKALKLYAEAVADMKQRANSDPYSWNQQAGTHGSLLGTRSSTTALTTQHFGVVSFRTAMQTNLQVQSLKM